MKFLKKLLGIQRKTIFDIYKKGIHCYNILDYSKAIDYFEQVIADKSISKSLEYKLAKFYCGRANINIAITLFARNQSSKALFHFKKALLFNPEDTDLNYFLGICLNNIGDFKGAMESFTKIVETEPWNIPTKLKMAIIFHNLGMWKNAEEIHRSILEKNPCFADVHFHLGLSLMGQGRTAEAAEALKDALNINPNYTDARLKLGIAQICMGTLEDAFKNLSQIVEKHPNYADVYYLISIIHTENNQPEKAVRSLKQALEIAPKYKNALVKLIIAYCQTGNFQAAEALIVKALESYPDDKRLSSVQKSLAIFDPTFKSVEKISMEVKIGLKDEQSIKELRNEFHKNLEIMPSFSEIIKIFSSSRYAQEDSSIPSFLIPFITEQINKNPTYPDLYNSLGTQLLLCNKTIEAENAFSKAIELNPDYVTAHINLLKTLHKNGKNEDAYEHGKYLLEKKLPFPDVYYTLTTILIELKRYDEALVNANRVLKLRPAMKKANLLIANIYEQQGNYDAAIKSIKKYLAGKTELGMATKARALLEKLQKK